MRPAVIVVSAMVSGALAGPVRADQPVSSIEEPTTDRPSVTPATPAAPQPIRGFAVRGNSKLRPRTVGYLARVALGELVDAGDIPRLEQALLSSELFKTVSVALEPAPGVPGAPDAGVLVVVTADDKQSWIAAPTVYALPGNRAFGVGFAENNFRGRDQKFLIYGQLGTRDSLLFATFLDPAYHGTKLTWRTDLYLYRRALDEYVNPPGDPASLAIARTTSSTYLGGGALIGWRFLWWLVGDLRLRGAYVYFRNPEDADGAPLPAPERDGWDVSLQTQLTLDNRHHRYGVSWGSYAQLRLESTVPGLDDYGYQLMMLRAYHSWRLLGAHELELRGQVQLGRHLPAHEEVTLGGVGDLRGYSVEQFRGDLRTVARAEYSVPLFQWRFLAFRALGFYDGGYAGFYRHREAGRDYLPGQRGDGYWRNDVGAGLRIYVDNVVLPLLGFDLGYGLEGRALKIYFEVGLTDF